MLSKKVDIILYNYHEEGRGMDGGGGEGEMVHRKIEMKAAKEMVH